MKHIKNRDNFLKEGFLNPKNWKRKTPPIPESGEERKAWLNKYDPMPELGDWDNRKAWLDKYDPVGWKEAIENRKNIESNKLN